MPEVALQPVTWLSHLLGTAFNRNAPAPVDVDLGTDEFTPVARQGNVVVARSVDVDEDHFGDDGSRIIYLRAYQWEPRHSRWIVTGRLHALWCAGPSELLIADLVIFEEHRSHGHGTRLLLACKQLGSELGARIVTGNLSAVDDVERLKRWYTLHGFTAVPARDPGMVASVVWMP